MLEFGPLGSGPGREGLDSGNLGSGSSSGWEEALDLDWLTDHEVRYLLPPTQRTRYQTKVFQQSVTVVIKLQQNNTGGASAVAERGVVVGPWRVPEEQLPVLVGTITAASLLLLLLLSLLLYTCCQHAPRHKNYNFGCPKTEPRVPNYKDELIRHCSGKSVKSEVSSMTSGHTQGSGPSLSRDSLVVVTHASSGHQACLISDRDSPSEAYLFECECYCDDQGFQRSSCDPQASPCPCQCCPDDEEDEDGSECTSGGVFEEEGSEGDLPRSLSMPIKEHVQGVRCDKDGREVTNNNSVRAKVTPRPNPAAFIPCDLTLPRQHRRDRGGGGGGEGVGLEGVCLPMTLDHRMEDHSASSSAVDAVSPCGSRDGDVLGGDEAFRTRSLPAWVRNKTRPLAALDDLNTIYEKPHWSKRRRNRMRSDAAAVIALTKSRGRLMSTGSGQGSSHGTATPTAPDTAALVENEAVIVYDERTAL